MPVLEALVEVNSLPWPCSAMAWRSRAAPTPWLRCARHHQHLDEGFAEEVMVDDQVTGQLDRPIRPRACQHAPSR
jgi:hypothetical protein